MTKLTYYFNFPIFINIKNTLYVFLTVIKYQSLKTTKTTKELFLLNKKTPYVAVRSF